MFKENLFNYGGYIELIGNGYEMFQNSNVNVAMAPESEPFQLICQDNDENCENVMYTCLYPNCKCSGTCPDIIYYDTANPTSSS